MLKVDMHEAKAILSKLMHLALAGEDVAITRDGNPVVRLVPFQPPEGLRPVGLHRLPLAQAAEAFNFESMRPLTAEEMTFWTTDIAPPEEPG